VRRVAVLEMRWGCRWWKLLETAYPIPVGPTWVIPHYAKPRPVFARDSITEHMHIHPYRKEQVHDK
jgi:hypothetical protein